MIETVHVIKIGGNIIDDEAKLAAFLQDFARIEGRKVLVHGGGKLATRLAEALNLPQQLVEGRRITDAETLKVVTMVYAGYINKNLVAQLHAAGCPALGLSGADGDAIRAHKRPAKNGMDYGFAGDVEMVNVDLLASLLEKGIAVVLAPITHDGEGQLLNTNADTIAQEAAKALAAHYHVRLVYSFEKSGVLRDAGDESSLIASITPLSYDQLKADGSVHSGMIPKLDNAFAALRSGVREVIIGKAEQLPQLVLGQTGTRILHG